jgi:histidinol-phosphate aminotransferase
MVWVSRLKDKIENSTDGEKDPLFRRSSMKRPDEFVVPWVRQSKSYSDRHLDLAWERKDLHRMMGNENPFTPPEHLADSILEIVRMGNVYPPSGEEIRDAIGSLNGLTMDHVLLGNGSTEVIEIVIRTLVQPGDEVVIPVPTFGMYEARTRMSGGNPVRIPMREDLYWDIGGIMRAIGERTKLVFLCSPNNPTGQVMSTEDLHVILAREVPTVVDEAYYEFHDEKASVVPLVREHPNLIVLRTFSKAFGLSGFRAGYALGDPDVVKHFLQVKIPFNVNLTAMAVVREALKDPKVFRKRWESLRTEREYLYRELSKIRGLRVFPSQANFILMDATDLGISGEEIVQTLLEKDGILARVQSFHPDRKGFFRITVRGREENRLCLEALRRIFHKTP